MLRRRLERLERQQRKQAANETFTDKKAIYALCRLHAISLLHGHPLWYLLDHIEVAAEVDDVAGQLCYEIWSNDDTRALAVESFCLAFEEREKAADAVLEMQHRIYEIAKPRWDHTRHSYERAGHAERGYALFPPFTWPF